MKWFRGKLEGHYVGTTTGTPGVSQFGSAERYKLRIYRAIVRDIELLEDVEAEDAHADEDATVEAGAGEDANQEAARSATPQIPVDLPDDCFYQAQIEDTRMLGIRPRSCFDGPIYDVAVSDLTVTHKTKHGAKTYGRLEGDVYGRFLLPPVPDPEGEVVVPQEMIEADAPVESGSEKPLESAHAHIAAHEAGAAHEHEDGRTLEALHPPTPPKAVGDDDASREPANIPLPFLIIATAIVLGLSVGARPAFLFLGVFVPLLITRLILGGMFTINNAQRVLSAVLILVQFGCLGLIVLDWWSAGCLVLNIWAIAGIGVTALIASVLPSALALLCAGGSLAVVLFLWYGNVATTCEELEPKAPTATVEQPAQRSTVSKPATPRTNPDGSWPRRPPGPSPRSTP